MSSVSDDIRAAISLQQADRLPEAEAALREVLARAPQCADAHHLLGVLSQQCGRTQAAIERIRRAIRLSPNTPTYHHNLSLVWSAAQRPNEAVAAAEEAVHLRPQDAPLVDNLGHMLIEAGRPDEAAGALKRAAELDPTSAKIHNNLGVAYYEMGRLDEAIRQSRKAIELSPHYAKAHNSLGLPLQEQGDVEGAIATYRRAVQLDPDYSDAQFNLTLAHLLQGDFGRGWRDYALRTERRGQVRRKHPWPTWDGASLKGKTVLVFGEQGVGDEVMFASCLGEVVQQADHCAARVIVECDRRLAELVRRSFPKVTVYPRRKLSDLTWLAELERIDVCIAIGSLPMFLRRSLESFPRHDGYLTPDAQRCRFWKKRFDQLGPGPKIGISWRGGAQTVSANRRSTDLALWQEILATEGVCFVNLQAGDVTAPLEAVQRQLGVRVHTWPNINGQDDLDSLAAQIASLDLVISAQNTNVHLAGAVGVSTWVALPLAYDWRWMLQRSDSPWYPSVRLFRQTRAGRWHDVFERLRIALQQHVSHTTYDAAPLDR
ncbi:MAG: tetratricopeptide repeat protein [Planctomycetes bacterium]|nr:tetratricopeptide repeat protein [Planctomycetota bacterium]